MGHCKLLRATLSQIDGRDEGIFDLSPDEVVVRLASLMYETGLHFVN